MHCTMKYSQHSSIICLIKPNGWVFIYELSSCRFYFRCSHLNLRYYNYFEQGVPWRSGNYRVWIHSGIRTWNYKNIQSNAPYRKVLITKLNHLASWTKWLIFRLGTSDCMLRTRCNPLNVRYRICFD